MAVAFRKDNRLILPAMVGYERITNISYDQVTITYFCDAMMYCPMKQCCISIGIRAMMSDTCHGLNFMMYNIFHK